MGVKNRQGVGEEIGAAPSASIALASLPGCRTGGEGKKEVRKADRFVDRQPEIKFATAAGFPSG